MPAILTYPDAYLAKFCTEERETRAFADVDALGTFATDWRNKLTRARCCILACIENQAAPDDLFTAKLKSYRDEFSGLLKQARTATEDDDGNPLPALTVSLERA